MSSVGGESGGVCVGGGGIDCKLNVIKSVFELTQEYVFNVLLFVLF